MIPSVQFLRKGSAGLPEVVEDVGSRRPDLSELPTDVVDLLVLRVSQWLSQADRTEIPVDLVPVAGFRPGHRHRDMRARATLASSLTKNRALAAQVGDWVSDEKGPGLAGQDAATDEMATAWLGGDSDRLAELLAQRSTTGDSAPKESDRVASLEKRIGELQVELAGIHRNHKRKTASSREKSARQTRELADARSQLIRMTNRVQEVEAKLASLKTGMTETAATANDRDAQSRARIRSLESELDRTRRDRGQDRRSSRYLEHLELARIQVLLSAARSAISGLTSEIPSGNTGQPAELVRSNERPTNPLPRRPGPNQLQDWLVVPGLHLLVDGYNVSMAATPDLPLAKQRELLVGRLCALVARTEAEVTVVFDAQNVNLALPSGSRRGTRVIFTDEGEIADDVIVEMVSVEPPGRAVMVITSDQELSSRVTRLGARAVPSEDFISVLDRG
jgi:predicted RNA-binding protein with PIN domain